MARTARPAAKNTVAKKAGRRGIHLADVDEGTSDHTVVMQLPTGPAGASDKADWTSLVDEFDK
jgi:hypothetical protein